MMSIDSLKYDPQAVDRLVERVISARTENSSEDISTLLSELTDLVINDGDSEHLLVLLTTASVLEERLELKTDRWNKDALAASLIKRRVVGQTPDLERAREFAYVGYSKNINTQILGRPLVGVCQTTDKNYGHMLADVKRLNDLGFRIRSAGNHFKLAGLFYESGYSEPAVKEFATGVTLMLQGHGDCEIRFIVLRDILHTIEFYFGSHWDCQLKALFGVQVRRLIVSLYDLWRDLRSEDFREYVYLEVDDREALRSWREVLSDYPDADADESITYGFQSVNIADLFDLGLAHRNWLGTEDLHSYIASRADYISALDLSDKEKADWYWLEGYGDEIPMDELMGAVCYAIEGGWLGNTENPFSMTVASSDNFNSYLSWQILEAVDRERFDAKLDAVLNRNIGDSGFSVLFDDAGACRYLPELISSDFANDYRVGATDFIEALIQADVSFHNPFRGQSLTEIDKDAAPDFYIDYLKLREGDLVQYLAQDITTVLPLIAGGSLDEQLKKLSRDKQLELAGENVPKYLLQLFVSENWQCEELSGLFDCMKDGARAYEPSGQIEEMLFRSLSNPASDYLKFALATQLQLPSIGYELNSQREFIVEIFSAFLECYKNSQNLEFLEVSKALNESNLFNEFVVNRFCKTFESRSDLIQWLIDKYLSSVRDQNFPIESDLLLKALIRTHATRYRDLSNAYPRWSHYSVSNPYREAFRISRSIRKFLPHRLNDLTEILPKSDNKFPSSRVDSCIAGSQEFAGLISYALTVDEDVIFENWLVSKAQFWSSREIYRSGTWGDDPAADASKTVRQFLSFSKTSARIDQFRLLYESDPTLYSTIISPLEWGARILLGSDNSFSENIIKNFYPRFLIHAARVLPASYALRLAWRADDLEQKITIEEVIQLLRKAVITRPEWRDGLKGLIELPFMIERFVLDRSYGSYLQGVCEDLIDTLDSLDFDLIRLLSFNLANFSVELSDRNLNLVIVGSGLIELENFGDPVSSELFDTPPTQNFSPSQLGEFFEITMRAVADLNKNPGWGFSFLYSTKCIFYLLRFQKERLSISDETIQTLSSQALEYLVTVYELFLEGTDRLGWQHLAIDDDFEKSLYAKQWHELIVDVISWNVEIPSWFNTANKLKIPEQIKTLLSLLERADRRDLSINGATDSRKEALVALCSPRSGDKALSLFQNAAFDAVSDGNETLLFLSGWDLIACYVHGLGTLKNRIKALGWAIWLDHQIRQFNPDRDDFDFAQQSISKGMSPEQIVDAQSLAERIQDQFVRGSNS